MASSAKVCVAWFEADHWERLRDVSNDSSSLESTYEEWLSNIEKTIQEMNSGGLVIHKVPIEVNELVDWCETKDIQVDSKSRSEYAAYKLEHTAG